ncbi:hypothetical protein [Prosthecobacter sp.]|uniref:hypothetical protein n=1 Tax=Prosthecobacter sp. TaxID=1965333 RepID=UPI00248780D5|nr:hypothetical protein [Prosthecobacter sp.]MDI1311367.1 hypothetical protein [Prosthecobacter sp.]
MAKPTQDTASAQGLICREKLAACFCCSIETIKRMEEQGILKRPQLCERLMRYGLSDVHTAAFEGSISMTQTWLPMECAPVASVPLYAVDIKQLHTAGAGASELAAVQRVANAEDREALLNFIAFICPQNFRRLRAVVRLVRCWQERGHPMRCGADIIYNGARAQFRDFGHGGSNDERCFITRALAVVAPDLKGMLEMKREGKANILAKVGWHPSGRIDWSPQALPPLAADELTACVMPL